MRNFVFCICCLLVFSCQQNGKENIQIISINKTATPPIIDGMGNEACWVNTAWLPIDQRWIGDPYNNEDFRGKYKVIWDNAALYLLVQIHDNVLFDQNKDPLVNYQDDDGLLIFIDEDNSGGAIDTHNNTFTYTVGLDNNVVATSNQQPKLFNNHITCKRITYGKISTWELKINVYPNTHSTTNNTPITLQSDKEIGFAIGYLDNDNSQQSENLTGSVFINRELHTINQINANYFGTLLLKE